MKYIVHNLHMYIVMNYVITCTSMKEERDQIWMEKVEFASINLEKTMS